MYISLYCPFWSEPGQKKKCVLCLLRYTSLVITRAADVTVLMLFFNLKLNFSECTWSLHLKNSNKSNPITQLPEHVVRLCGCLFSSSVCSGSLASSFELLPLVVLLSCHWPKRGLGTLILALWPVLIADVCDGWVERFPQHLRHLFFGWLKRSASPPYV